MSGTCRRCGKPYGRNRSRERLVLSSWKGQTVQSYVVCDWCARELTRRFYEECDRQRIEREDAEWRAARDGLE